MRPDRLDVLVNLALAPWPVVRELWRVGLRRLSPGAGREVPYQS